ncbi:MULTISPECIES: acyl-CoA reductase [Dickeya]|uniref:Coenzyme F390 synthetase n=1 Tax=Dickeya aquatica TaxID=1401087 RepID=A0A375ACD4_9GAMM|nr:MULTISPECIES: acyl-CoA reductase [Dickeya]SLM63733.1 Coenzyme F390 synthetase [Dickeya aquatica]
MLHNFERITILVGSQLLIEQLSEARPLIAFESRVIDFLDSLSKNIFKNTKAKDHPDVITLAFWCRKASILGIKDKEYPSLGYRLGRGVAFHIAPSNVALNFAYSLFSGLLTGNASVVRVPSKAFPQIDLLCEEINRTLSDFPDLSPYIILLRYPRDKIINDYFSSICRTRLIWGGDLTISTLQASPANPRNLDIVFSDRYSICIIDAESYLAVENKEKIASDFYNDTLLSDQNACTSPKLIVWLGNNKTTAMSLFWEKFSILANERYELNAVSAVRKLADFYKLCASHDGVKKISDDNNTVFRIQLSHLDNNTMSYSGNCGYFMEYMADDISEIYPVCGERCQTIATLGVRNEVIHDFMMHYKPLGIDRVVPIGKTLDFSMKWDGYDLVYSMTRGF